MRTGTDPVSSDSAATVVVTPRDVSVVARPGKSLRADRPSAAFGLGTKIFLGAALLVVSTLGVAVAVSTWRANEIAERSIRAALREIPRTVHAYRGSLETQLKATLRSIAEEPGTKGLFDTDVRTIHDWTDAKASVLSAKVVFLFDREGALICRSDKPAGEDQGRPFRSVRWVAEPLDSRKEASAAIREGKVLAVVAAVPVVAGDATQGEARLMGVLAAAVPLDDARAKAVRGLTGGQVVFVADVAKRGEPPQLAVSASTEAATAEQLVPALAADPAAVEALFRQGRDVGPLDLVVAGEQRIVAAVPIRSAGGDTLGALVVSRSREEETAAFRQIRTTLLTVGALALLVSIPVSLVLSRGIARPLKQLADGAIAIREGKLDVVIPQGGNDEAGTLARAFVSMVEELKEKAQLEQLLAEIRRKPSETRATVVRPVAGTPAALRTPHGSVAAGLTVGQSVAGRYQILSVLGRGGMGSVYQVFDRELEEDVALKVLTPEAFDEGTEAVRTLKQEIRLARKITHPNVVRTHDLGEADGVLFLTMEYVPGTTLRELIDRRGALALAPGLQIAKQLCRGLTAVHEAGIIHRDIKPQNIMVLPTGVVKLMDFGIARAQEAADTESQMGQTIGTPYYMSPEQARGEGLDSRSDIYTVGVVLFELFTGTRPFEGRDLHEVMRKHVSEAPPSPRTLRPDLPEALGALILSCLAKAPERRPPSVNDLYGALMRLGA